MLIPGRKRHIKLPPWVKLFIAIRRFILRRMQRSWPWISDRKLFTAYTKRIIQLNCFLNKCLWRDPNRIICRNRITAMRSIWYHFHLYYSMYWNRILQSIAFWHFSWTVSWTLFPEFHIPKHITLYSYIFFYGGRHFCGVTHTCFRY